MGNPRPSSRVHPEHHQPACAEPTHHAARDRRVGEKHGCVRDERRAGLARGLAEVQARTTGRADSSQRRGRRRTALSASSRSRGRRPRVDGRGPRRVRRQRRGPGVGAAWARASPRSSGRGRRSHRRCQQDGRCRRSVPPRRHSRSRSPTSRAPTGPPQHDLRRRSPDTQIRLSRSRWIVRSPQDRATRAAATTR
jgi:hypothetical protein